MSSVYLLYSNQLMSLYDKVVYWLDYKQKPMHEAINVMNEYVRDMLMYGEFSHYESLVVSDSVEGELITEICHMLDSIYAELSNVNNWLGDIINFQALSNIGGYMVEVNRPV